MRYDSGVIQTVKVNEIMALHDAGVAIIDVRSAAEFAGGHIPHAVNIPLEQLRSNATQMLLPERLLFVCARGVRSLEAANLAIAAGRTEVYSLEGGTQAWQAAGQPIERAVAASLATEAHPSSGSPAAATAAAGTADEEPLDPALDHLIARNLRELRKQRGWSLDDLARMMNVSRSLLGQLELEVGTERYSLDEGDAIVFAADVVHAYINRGSRECWMNLVITYGQFR